MGHIRRLLHEGKQHRILIRNEKGRVLIKLSVTWAVIIALGAPQVAVGVGLAALAGIVTIDIETLETNLEAKLGP